MARSGPSPEILVCMSAHSKNKRSLSVNVDHIATIRQARGTSYPAPEDACRILAAAGALGVTLHLRGDRRHIQDADVRRIRQISTLPLTLEMAATDEMIKVALEVRPDAVTFVPERPEEKTTEGGLDCIKESGKVGPAVEKMKRAGIFACIFLEPDEAQAKAAAALGAEALELHTGAYAEFGEAGRVEEMENAALRIEAAATCGESLGLLVNAGHGLHYTNIQRLVRIRELREFSIGHAIIGRSLFTGLETAVRDMVRLIQGE